MKKIILGLVTVILVVFTIMHFAKAQVLFFPNKLIEGEAPDFFEKTVKGKEFTFDKVYRKNKNIVLFFWATWCPHCRTAIANFPKQLPELKKQNIEMVLINVGEDKNVVKRYLSTVKIDPDIILDKSGKVSTIYGVAGLPTFVLIDKDGIVKAVEHALPNNFGYVFK